MRIDELVKYNEQIDNIHKNTDQHTGYEINDRGIFINSILNKLGYKEKNILQDVPQKGETGSKSADIRLYGNNEYKSKHSHSQFVIETKNYKLLSSKKYEIDYLQLKRYIKYNESKIRLIALTDYNLLILFNATEIKKNNIMNFNNMEYISESEVNIFKTNCFIEINLENISETTLNSLNIISYKKVFENQKFINPQDYEATNSIIDPHVRKNFILVLYHLMVKLQKEIDPAFVLRVIDVQSQISLTNIDRSTLNKLLTQPQNLPIRNYFLWGFEMHYLENFIDHKNTFDPHEVNLFLADEEKKDAFILTSIYNLINKTMFLRILEDTSTTSTKFVEGIKNGRYISNGILEEKRKESITTLVRYFIEVFKFEQSDLKLYDFILSKDIYNWILDLNEYLITDLLVELIRLFNDINFNKVNQDILGDIYEHYLEQEEEEGSKKTYRRLLGQYYTPKPIVRLMWYLTRDVIRKNFDRDLYSEGEEYFSIIDPACGSGTFISEAVLQINEVASKKKVNKDGKVFGFIKKRNDAHRIENSLYGFELNPLSKSIADINLFFSLTQAYGGYSRSEFIKMINVFRLDSLTLNNNDGTDEDPEFEDSIMFLQEDIKKSYLQKYYLNKARSKKYNIVIGNPPYGPTKVNKEMRNNILPFAFPENNFDKNGKNIEFTWGNTDFEGEVPSNEKNIGKLNDLYGYFFGVADRLCEENGIVSFITSNTYLTIPSYKWFRKYLLENYTIDYLINFNKVSEKANSMFYPDASVATSIIIMRKSPASSTHTIKYLDLSHIDNIKGKYETFSNIEWANQKGKVNKNNIKKFEIKDLNKMNFKTMPQSSLLRNKDYIFSFNESLEMNLLEKIMEMSVPVTSYSQKNMGIDVGDLILVQKKSDEVEHIIKNVVFKKNFKNLKSTLKKHLINQFKLRKINPNFDEKKIVKFVYQKHLQPYSIEETYYTYLDSDILWRARIKDKSNPFISPIYSNRKLFLLERRAKEQVLSLVTDDILVPQHGGRFMYLVESEKLNIEEMYLLSAIINSSVLQYLYKKRLIGNKDILVAKLEIIEDDLRFKLIEISKKIHYLELQKTNYNNNYSSNSLSESRKINILDNNKYWDIKIDDVLIPDYNVDTIGVDYVSNILTLNDNIHVFVKDREKLAKLYEQIKNYNGNLIQNPLFINILQLTSEGENYIKKIDDKLIELNEKVNNLVYKVYDLTEEEISLIIN